MKRIALITTGGTIEKTYNELSGLLDNSIAVLDVMLSQLELRGIDLSRVPLMNKDSLEMTDDDHNFIADTALRFAAELDGVVVVHGTDRLAESGERVLNRDASPKNPIVFTGAMRPWELRTTDAMQNLTEACLAVQVFPAGVYVAMHNQVLEFPGVRKDVDLGTFTKQKLNK